MNFFHTSTSAFIIVFAISLFSACEGQESETPEPNPTPAPEVPETPKSYELVWSDEFENPEIDSLKWEFQLGDGSEYGISGWGNNELEYYTDRPENVFIEDGNLVIQALRESYEGAAYTSARLRTKDLADWKFGRFEIRARLPKGQGIWPAIWMLPTLEVFGGWPKSGEIDIMEAVGHEPEKVHGTIHFGQDWPENKFIGKFYALDQGDFTDDFHVFSIEWEQDKIAFLVDGDTFFNVSRQTTSPHTYPFNQIFHLILNVAVGGNWPGNPDASTQFPQRMEVDYVRVYQLQ